MTAYRFVALTCDGCGEIFDHGFHRSFRGCRREAKGFGWEAGKDQYGAVLDWCPRCQPGA